MNDTIVLCPGQGAQAVGMGQAWRETEPAAAAIFAEADEILGDRLGAPLSSLCFDGPASRLDETVVSQPAIFTCSVASFHGIAARDGDPSIQAAAGLSLGEYTALHLAGVFDFATGLELVATRGRLMQDAAEASDGGMVALIGADEPAASELAADAAGDGVLVSANFNAPGQIVLSGDASACDRATELAGERGLRATRLSVAGAFHSPLMEPAAQRMRAVLAEVTLEEPRFDVWSNVTAEPHPANDPELLRQRLVEQIVRPVRWAECCQAVDGPDTMRWIELSPGAVLRGLMRRIDRSKKVHSHDKPPETPVGT